MKPIKIFNFNISKKKRNDLQTSATTQHILEFDIYEFSQLFIFSKSFGFRYFQPHDVISLPLVNGI